MGNQSLGEHEEKPWVELDCLIQFVLHRKAVQNPVRKTRQGDYMGGEYKIIECAAQACV